MSLANNYEKVLDAIRDACLKAHRDSTSVSLLAVSKGHSSGAIQALYGLGHRDFGENYFAELKEKHRELSTKCPGIRWHYIGGLQTKKVKKIATIAQIDTLFHLKHMEALGKIEPSHCRVLLQVKFEEDSERPGVPIASLLDKFGGLSQFENIRSGGLMTVLPLGCSDPVGYFERVRNVRDKVEQEFGVQLPELSMGMSEDFEAAIQAGSTCVRLGTAIFGPRPS